MIALVSPQCITPRASAGRSIYDPSKNIWPTTRRNIQWLLLCFSMAAAAAPPSASHPGRRGDTALHRAAWEGHAAVVEQLISAGATVDAADNKGRGPGRVSGSFWEWLWWGDRRGSYMGRWFSAVLWDVEWYLYLLFKDPLLCWDGPVAIRMWEMAKHGGQRHEWNGKQKDVDAEWPMRSQSSAWPDLMQTYCGCFAPWVFSN